MENLLLKREAEIQEKQKKADQLKSDYYRKWLKNCNVSIWSRTLGNSNKPNFDTENWSHSFLKIFIGQKELYLKTAPCNLGKFSVSQLCYVYMLFVDIAPYFDPFSISEFPDMDYIV